MDCVADVGGMVVKIKFILKNANKIEPFEQYFCANIDECLGDNKKNMYRYGHNIFLHKIKNVVIDIKNLTVFSEVNIFKEHAHELTGILANNEISIVEGIVITSQLMQCLLYKLDGIKRENSNNLWMREMYFNQEYSSKKNVNTCKVFAKEVKLVNVKNEAWRLASIEGNIGNMTIGYQVAHKLPKDIIS